MSRPAVAMEPSTVKTKAPAMRASATAASGVPRGTTTATGTPARAPYTAAAPPALPAEGIIMPFHTEGARLGNRHPEPARLEGAGGVLSLVLPPEPAHSHLRGQPRQLEQRRAAFPQGDGLLAVGKRHQLTEAVHPGRAQAERVLGDGGRHLAEVVADREHLAAGLADGEQAARLVALPQTVHSM